MMLTMGMLAALFGVFCAFAVPAAANEGFLAAATAPDSLVILPAPPREDTVAFQADKAGYETGRTVRDAARMELARRDADYENFGPGFSEAFGMQISPAHTPKLYALLLGVLQDSHDYAVKTAKDSYQRVRPFVVYKDASCTPERDKTLATTGSYPSGHASFGWAVALVLAEINPARQAPLLRRGHEFGVSRVVCGAHWQSDVQAGQLMGAAIVAALHANGEFTRALNAAKDEFATLRAGEGK